MREDARALAAIAVLVTVLVAGIGSVAISLPSEGGSADAVPGDTRDATGRLERLHAAGYTGENVSVGVLDVTGFDTRHEAIDGRIAGARAFSPSETIANGGRNDHGTAAASLVARTAPDADLYLASFDTTDGYRAAITWLVDRDVDVIVAPVSFYGKPGDGTSRVERATARAVERGVVFVAPAGNLGRSHWQGRFEPVGGGTHLFADGTRNYLAAVGGRRITLWLSWPREHRDRDFTLELHWTNGTASRLVERSQPYLADDVPNERIVARVAPNGAYYYVVRGPADAAGTRIKVSSPTHGFQFNEPAGSVVAPATVPETLAVGADDARRDRIESFSSRGPTDGGLAGVDLVAPDRLPAARKPAGFVGSSAAAPYVAGVAALVFAENPSLDPRQVEAVLRACASDVGPRGRDPLSGDGLVRPGRAVDRVGGGER